MTILLSVLVGCGKTSEAWPASELAKLRTECEVVTDEATAAMERAACHCLYDRLPARVSWTDFSAWREADGHDGAVRDPKMTKEVAEVSAKCAVEARTE